MGRLRRRFQETDFMAGLYAAWILQVPQRVMDVQCDRAPNRNNNCGKGASSNEQKRREIDFRAAERYRLKLMLNDR